MDYSLIIFDVDGTLTTTRSGNTFRSKWTDATGREHSPESDWMWIPGRLERLKQIANADVKVAFASNQGGVAFGFLRWPILLQEMLRMAAFVSLDAMGRIYLCFSHPHGNVPDFTKEDNRRKPGSGMLEEAMEEAHVLPSKTLSVGDRPEDEEAARNAGCDFQWADDFFAEEPYTGEPEDGVVNLSAESVARKEPRDE